MDKPNSVTEATDSSKPNGEHEIRSSTSLGPVWDIGSIYDYYGAPIRPIARSFDGELELIDFEWVPPQMTPEGMTFRRAARTLAPCVKPSVTETLGGVSPSRYCKHDWPDDPKFVARFGPNEGTLCCSSCGGRA